MIKTGSRLMRRTGSKVMTKTGSKPITRIMLKHMKKPGKKITKQTM